jgi:hypothetical protein
VSDTDGNTSEWSEEEYEKLFASIGKYVVFFQLIEARVDELLLLAWGHENWEASQRKLVGMPNEKKIQRLASEVLQSVDFRRVHTRPDWVSRLKLSSRGFTSSESSATQLFTHRSYSSSRKRVLVLHYFRIGPNTDQM